MNHPRLVLLARTSTDEHQSPEDSLRWQREAAENLIRGRAVIVDTAHDADVSRSLPWQRRPAAGKLIDAMADPDRGWEGVVIAEAARAFGDTSQYQSVAQLMNHWAVQLWTPEVGGPVDFASDSHDLIMSLLGSVARGERNRMRWRRGCRGSPPRSGRWWQSRACW